MTAVPGTAVFDNVPRVTIQAPTIATDAERKAAWLLARSKAITGTDAAKILTGKAFDVWLEKTGRGAAFDETNIPDYMRAGNYYERGTLAWYADREGVALAFADSYEFIRHPNPELSIGCTLDARRMDDGCPVDAKHLQRWTPYDAETGTGWGENGSDLVPTYYAVQMAVQMEVLDTDRASLAVFFRVDGEFKIYHLTRDRERGARMLTALSGWYQRHIVGGEQPPIGTSEAAADFLKALPRTSDVIRKATPEEEKVAAMLRIVREDLAQLEPEKERLTNLLRAAVGDGLGIAGNGWKFTHKAPAAKQEVDYEMVTRTLTAELARTAGPQVAAKVLGDAIDNATTIKQSGRRADFRDVKTTAKES